MSSEGNPAAPPHGGIGSAPSTSSFTRQRPQLTTLEKLVVGRPEPAFNALAGAAGGFTSGVVTCPLDVIKTKLQAQGGFRAGAAPGAQVYSGMLGTARVIWREEGLKGMYRGLGPIILGYLPTWAVWFTVYGKSKKVLSNSSGELDPLNPRGIVLTMTFQKTKSLSTSGLPSLPADRRQWLRILYGLSKPVSCPKSAAEQQRIRLGLHGTTSQHSMQRVRCTEPKECCPSTPD